MEPNDRKKNEQERQRKEMPSGTPGDIGGKRSEGERATQGSPGAGGGRGSDEESGGHHQREGRGEGEQGFEEPGG